MLAAEGLSEKVEVESAGTSAWHQGDPPDGRSAYHASLRGYQLSGASRQVLEQDFKDFDLILAMDQKNKFDLEKLCPTDSALNKIKLITDYCVQHNQSSVEQGVPDPYHRGEEGFELVLDIIEDACYELIKKEIAKKV